jgi:hypothetical protein
MTPTPEEREPSLVAGDTMTIPQWEFERACERLLADEQEKISPDNALISTLCEAVRLSRECCRMATVPIAIPKPPAPTVADRCEEWENYDYGFVAALELATNLCRQVEQELEMEEKVETRKRDLYGCESAVAGELAGRLGKLLEEAKVVAANRGTGEAKPNKEAR